jgi:predicted nucleic acid-binding protein
VDSNLAIFTVVDSNLSQLATRVWSHLLSTTVNIFAPGLWAYETTSVIRKLYSVGKITEEEAQKALIILDQMPIQLISSDLSIRQAALIWATRLGQKAAYDSFYLATAEKIDAEFWTADQALANNARQAGARWVHWIGEFA